MVAKKPLIHPYLKAIFKGSGFIYMLVSLRWLKDYVDIRISPAELVDRLTMAGFEVESIRETGPSFTNVVVA